MGFNYAVLAYFTHSSRLDLSQPEDDPTASGSLIRNVTQRRHDSTGSFGIQRSGRFITKTTLGW